VHGEPQPMDVLKRKIEERFGWTVHTPAYREELQL
jgi:hypothetical protein